MRVWSLHPGYLDRQGLVACWRETLLAQAVLAGLAPMSRWQAGIKTATCVAARFVSAGEIGTAILGRWSAALPEPDVNAVGAMQKFWNWVLARMHDRGLPLEELEVVSLRLPFSDDAPVPYLC